MAESNPVDWVMQLEKRLSKHEAGESRRDRNKQQVKTVVINKFYQTEGASSQDCVAQAWEDDEGHVINENQELSKDWSTAESFAFWKSKHAISQHQTGNSGEEYIITEDGIIAVKWDKYWVVVQFPGDSDTALG